MSSSRAGFGFPLAPAPSFPPVKYHTTVIHYTTPDNEMNRELPAVLVASKSGSRADKVPQAFSLGDWRNLISRPFRLLTSSNQVQLLTRRKRLGVVPVYHLWVIAYSATK
ncbi:hypothetical protein BDQ94DRAFT_164289 [Aspergillus welwitschiae]|uniref:Uncharacterized protein n=1 Tax=Aspergillus welwitschiae TaxID=1341132 RepID=A0A3F3PIB5_9EURO|nr:hypothetical protein BDQ94DRAFT_164289 [Aspergillus welwitschiae]RDH26679.1 hypothetical protein BDQ94DRAFT_164289 [Aspergillus welwitschiae]